MCPSTKKSELKMVRKAAFKVVRESEKIQNYSAAKVDDAIRDLARVLRGDRKSVV